MKVWIVNDSREGGDTAFTTRRKAEAFITDMFDDPMDWLLSSMEVEISAANVLRILSGGGYATHIKYYDTLISKR